jgi:hypothetical protein
MERAEQDPAAAPAARHRDTERTATGDARTGRAASTRAPSDQTSDRTDAQASAPQSTEATAAEATAAEASAQQVPVTHGPGNGRSQAPAQPASQPGNDKAADEAPARGRGKKAAGPRGRRSSVPSWDEIMLGNSRQPE